jgi:hypothetical protein
VELPQKDLQRQVQGKLVLGLWEESEADLIEGIWYSHHFGYFSFSMKYSKDAIAGLLFVCPGCGELNYCCLDGTAEAGRNWSWNSDFIAPTLRPSILSNPEKGGCGWHGFLNRGFFELQPRD